MTSFRTSSSFTKPSFRAADLLGTSFTSTSTDVDSELGEEDIWDVDRRRSSEEATELAEGRDSEASGSSASLSEERSPASVMRVPNGRRWDTSLLTPFDDGSRMQGLSSALAPPPQDVLGRKTGVYDITSGRGAATPSRRIPHAGGLSMADSGGYLRRQSAPVNVPDWKKVAGPSAPKQPPLAGEVLEEEELDEGMVPPHELMAREYAQSMTFSVYEGVGRTLRGRDLNHVRTAVLRKTGFIDS
eukprot:jgi/Mesen1/7400/ME000388S06617